MRFFLLILPLILLGFGCSQKSAPIVNRGKILYDKSNGLNKEKYRNLPPIATAGKSADGQIEVSAGDTLYGISKKYHVALRDLIQQNNLTPPYILKSGTKLTIPTQNYHEVKTGETLYGISRLYGMKVGNLIEINNLKEPYSVKVGERIKISKSSSEISPSTPPTESIKVAEKKSEPVAEVGFVEKTLDKFNHFSWPIRGQIMSKFGPKSGGLYNDGINIKAKEGDAVKASEDGTIAYVGNELKGYGNLIIVKHSGGWITAYAHLKDTSVKRGQKVSKGEKIGSVGATGNVTSPQLYFGLRKGRDAVNPENHLRNL